MMKCGSKMKRSKYKGTINNRTSWDVRLPYRETPDTQRIFSEVLNMPVENMEALKVIRYQQGQHFATHDDAVGQMDTKPNGTAWCHEPYPNRVITLFVYLNDVEEGGETIFDHCNIAIKPQQGLGCIHFPAYMNNHRVNPQSKRGAKDSRAAHQGSEAISEKFICTQWGISGRYYAEHDGEANPLDFVSSTVL
jgi:hypothetical protein